MQSVFFAEPNTSTKRYSLRIPDKVWERYKVDLLREFRGGGRNGVAAAFKWIQREASHDLMPTYVYMCLKQKGNLPCGLLTGCRRKQIEHRIKVLWVKDLDETPCAPVSVSGEAFTASPDNHPSIRDGGADTTFAYVAGDPEHDMRSIDNTKPPSPSGARASKESKMTRKAGDAFHRKRKALTSTECLNMDAKRSRTRVQLSQSPVARAPVYRNGRIRLEVKKSASDETESSLSTMSGSSPSSPRTIPSQIESASTTPPAVPESHNWPMDPNIYNDRVKSILSSVICSCDGSTPEFQLPHFSLDKPSSLQGFPSALLHGVKVYRDYLAGCARFDDAFSLSLVLLMESMGGSDQESSCVALVKCAQYAVSEDDLNLVQHLLWTVSQQSFKSESPGEFQRNDQEEQRQRDLQFLLAIALADASHRQGRFRNSCIHHRRAMAIYSSQHEFVSAYGKTSCSVFGNLTNFCLARNALQRYSMLSNADLLQESLKFPRLVPVNLARQEDSEFARLCLYRRPHKDLRYLVQRIRKSFSSSMTPSLTEIHSLYVHLDGGRLDGGISGEALCVYLHVWALWQSDGQSRALPSGNKSILGVTVPEAIAILTRLALDKQPRGSTPMNNFQGATTRAALGADVLYNLDDISLESDFINGFITSRRPYPPLPGFESDLFRTSIEAVFTAVTEEAQKIEFWLAHAGQANAKAATPRESITSSPGRDPTLSAALTSSSVSSFRWTMIRAKFSRFSMLSKRTVRTSTTDELSDRLSQASLLDGDPPSWTDADPGNDMGKSWLRLDL